MSLESPLGRVLGHGSANAGTGHWWAQRLTAVALVPLTIWFAVFVLGLAHGQYGMVRSTLAEPTNAILLILMVLTLVYHSFLGLQVVIEDYVHGAAGVVTLIVTRFVHVILAVAGVYAVIVISIGGGQ